jgi:anti-anti-sigma factor
MDAVTRQLLFETEQRDDVCIVHMSGRLATGADVDYLGIQARAIKSLGCRKIVADIRKLDSIGSSGIGFFVGLHTSTLRNGGSFILVGPSPRVLEVLTLTRLSKIIPIASDLAAGLAFCARGADKADAARSSLG